MIQAFGLTGIHKTMRNRILGMVAKHNAPQRRLPLSSRHKRFVFQLGETIHENEYGVCPFYQRIMSNTGWARWMGKRVGNKGLSSASKIQTSARRWRHHDMGRYYRQRACWPCTCSTRSKTYIYYVVSVFEERTQPMAGKGTIITTEKVCIHA